MNKYNTFASDDRRGFINQKKILEYVSQEEIFELVFGYKPIPYVYVTSPFRIDRNPGCWFEATSSHIGKLRFIDFASNFGKPMDCFDAVQQFYEFSNFYLTLVFIYDKLISGRNKSSRTLIVIEATTMNDVVKPIINFDARRFYMKDGLYWEKKYGILKQNLIDDMVFPVKKFHIENGKYGDYNNNVYDLGYVYTNYESGNKKLYFPNRKGSKRFISTCTKNDIGGLKVLPLFGKELIITKSYKDWRVLKNNGKYAIYLQNEGSVPDMELLMSIVKSWSKVYVWFDNDRQGMKSSEHIANLINSVYRNKASTLHLPEVLNSEGISDPSDLYYHKGKQSLHEFFKTIK